VSRLRWRMHSRRAPSIRVASLLRDVRRAWRRRPPYSSLRLPSAGKKRPSDDAAELRSMKVQPRSVVRVRASGGRSGPRPRNSKCRL
jgi:hypothetical protein